MEIRPQTFAEAQSNYRRAQAAADRQTDVQRDRATAAVDGALDAFLSVPSPSPQAFGEKLSALQREYGCDAQPRHLAALYADASALA